MLMEQVEQAFYGHVVFCDDVRREIDGKLTLVGVYSSNLTVFGGFPAVLPKLCVVTWLNGPLADLTACTKITLAGAPLGDIRPELELGEKLKPSFALNDAARRQLTAILPLAPCTLYETGAIVVNAETETGMLTIGKLEVTVAQAEDSSVGVG
jgi:hypothetical protein